MKRIFAMILMSTVGLINHAVAATTEADAAYTASMNSAESTYDIAHAKCDMLSGNPKDVCLAQAKAARIRAEETAKMRYQNTESVRTNAAKAMAQADYEVAVTKCDNQNGNAQDVCKKQAEAIMITAISTVEANEKISDIRANARAEKHKAEYNVALEKCAAVSFKNKDACVANAKKQFAQ